MVKAVGEGVTHVKVGDRVLGNTGWGGMAEELALRSRALMPIPDAMPFDEAAAFIMTYGTSYYALKDRGHLKPGESLLVLGAAGGVGLAAVELGKAMGARVIAAASSQEKVDLAKARGADAGVVYPRGPFDKDGQRALADLFKDACGDERRRRDLRRRRRRLRRGRAALHRLGRPLPGDRLPRRHPAHPAQPRAAQGLRHRRRVLGRFGRRDPGRQRRQQRANCSSSTPRARSSRTSPRASRWSAAARRSPTWPAARRMGKVVVTIP